MKLEAGKTVMILAGGRPGTALEVKKTRTLPHAIAAGTSVTKTFILRGYPGSVCADCIQGTQH